MTVLLTVILATLHLENDDLVTFNKRVHYFYNYFGTLNFRCTDCHCSLIVYEQHLVELNSIAGFYILDVMYKELFALLCLKLLTVNFYDCVHFIYINGFFPQGGRPLPTLFRASTEYIGCKITKKERHAPSAHWKIIADLEEINSRMITTN